MTFEEPGEIIQTKVNQTFLFFSVVLESVLNLLLYVDGEQLDKI